MGLLLFGIIIGIILKHKTRSVLVFVYDEGNEKIEKEGWWWWEEYRTPFITSVSM